MTILVWAALLYLLGPWVLVLILVDLALGFAVLIADARRAIR